MHGLPEHTSASQLNCYAACPRRYRYRYLDHAEPEYRSVSLALGSAVHSAIGWWYAERRQGRTPSIDEGAEVVRADLSAALNGETRLGRWTEPDLAFHAEKLVRCFLAEHGDLPVKESEVGFGLELHDPETGEVLPRKLIGYLDFVLDDRRAVELKTARSNYTEVDVAASIQFGTYLRALRELNIADELDVTVIVKNKVPRLQEIRLHPTPAREAWTLATTSGIEQAILSGRYPLAPGRGCAQCEYSGRCLGVTEKSRDEAA